MDLIVNRMIFFNDMQMAPFFQYSVMLGLIRKNFKRLLVAIFNSRVFFVSVEAFHNLMTFLSLENEDIFVKFSGRSLNLCS